MRSLKSLTQYPRKVLLLDGLGATLTMILLVGVVLPFRENFGLPPTIILVLAGMGLVFASYSLGSYYFSTSSPARLLTPVIIGNTTYCLLSLGIVIYYADQLTLLGIGYLLVEIVVIALLVLFEWRTVKEGMQRDRDEQD